MSDLAAAELDLRGRRQAFVRATVVWARSPVSAEPGDKAVITADGRLRGWVGGSCAEPVVVREACRALEAGTPRLLRLGADEVASEADGVVAAPMSCASQGSLHIFLEPVAPPSHLVVIGRSPLTQALAQMARVLGFETDVVEREGGDLSELESPGVRVVGELDLAKAGVDAASFVVVATMGRYDEDAVEAALATHARYVSLVASTRRGQAVLESLRSSGVPDAQLARVKTPAGLPLGHLSHEETAVAILAEIVQLRRSGAPVAAAAAPVTADAVDPVCGMTVEISSATHTYTHAGTTYYFCCAGCRRSFEKDPTAEEVRR